MSFGGKFDYAKEYAKYKPNQDAKFESYVDDNPHLASAWEEIQSEPTGTQGSYWKQRGATSKAAFGRAHAAEDYALSEGTYHGGTDVSPYEEDTLFESWLAGGGNGNGGNGNGGGWSPATGGGAPGSANYPIGLVDYQEPSAMSGIPLEFQPWLQPSHIPDSLWNYQAPTLNEWEIDRNWDWAEKDASEYLTDDQKAAKARVAQQFREGSEGNRDGYNPMNDPANYMPGHELETGYYTGPDLNWDASASRKNFNWNNPLGAWANKNIYGMEDSNAMAAQIQAMQDIAGDDYMGNVSRDFGIGTRAGFDIGEIDPTQSIDAMLDSTKI
jgi:hypothetical protein